MIQTIVHPEGAAARTAAGHQHKTQPATIKLGVDIHQEFYVVVAQEGHETPKPARRLRPEEFVVWVERLLARGHKVFVVYEACSPIDLPPLVPGATASAALGSACAGGWRRSARPAT